MKIQSFFKFFLVILIISTFAISTFGSDKKPLPKTIEYKLDLKIDFDIEKLFANCEITILNSTNQSLEQIPILLYRLLTVKSVKNEGNTELPFTQKVISISGWEKLQVNFIEISLIKKIHPGEQQTIKLEYEGYLLGYSEAGWRYVKDHINKHFTIIRTDGFGYPIIGYPNDRDMMAIVTERYNYIINVTVPNDVIVVNGGKLIKKIDTDKNTTYVYTSRKPSWRLDIAVSDYFLIEHNENKVYSFSQDSLGAQYIMDHLIKSLNLYTNWFGSLHNYQGFTIIEVPEGYGSQADITSIMLTADNFKRSKELLDLYHEVSHLWNVKSLDSMPCRFQSEGLAKFLEQLLSEKINSKENEVTEAAEKYLNSIRTTFNKNPKFKTVPIKDYGVQDMTHFSYTLGMVVFTIFYEMVGEDQFNKIIGSFYSEYYTSGATLDEFIIHCNKKTSIELTKFFNDWIYTTKAIKQVCEGKKLKDFIRYYKSN